MILKLSVNTLRLIIINLEIKDLQSLIIACNKHQITNILKKYLDFITESHCQRLAHSLYNGEILFKDLFEKRDGLLDLRSYSQVSSFFGHQLNDYLFRKLSKYICLNFEDAQIRHFFTLDDCYHQLFIEERIKLIKLKPLSPNLEFEVRFAYPEFITKIYPDDQKKAAEILRDSVINWQRFYPQNVFNQLKESVNLVIDYLREEDKRYLLNSLKEIIIID